MDDFDKARGTKTEVYRNAARRTAGGLKKSDLMLNKSGKVVSKKASAAATKRFPEAQKKMCAYQIPPARVKKNRTRLEKLARGISDKPRKRRSKAK
jgi:hypothetical protein